MTDDLDLGIRVLRLVVPQLDLDETDAALGAMRSLGYRFVAPGTPGRMLETDDQRRGLVEHIRSATSLSFGQAFAVLDGLAKLGYRIREPDIHPSGLKTTEPAFTKVVGFGAKYAAAMKTVDKSQYDTNGIEIDKR